MDQVRAANVAAYLKRQGFRPSSPHVGRRLGLHVAQDEGRAHVWAEFELTSVAVLMIEAVRKALTTAGYRVEIDPEPEKHGLFVCASPRQATKPTAEFDDRYPI